MAEALVIITLLLAALVGFGLILLANLWNFFDGTAVRPSPLTPPAGTGAPTTKPEDEQGD